PPSSHTTLILATGKKDCWPPTGWKRLSWQYYDNALVHLISDAMTTAEHEALIAE
ncbi:hypothetical protein M9458_029614, partial [Cirrhinus mrigala]